MAEEKIDQVEQAIMAVAELPTSDSGETVTHRLKFPMLKIKGSDTPGIEDPKSVRLRPVYVEDLEAIDREDLSTTATTMVLIGRLTGMDAADVRRLHVADYQAIAGVIAARLGKGAGLAAMLSELATRAVGETT